MNKETIIISKMFKSFIKCFKLMLIKKFNIPDKEALRVSASLKRKKCSSTKWTVLIQKDN